MLKARLEEIHKSKSIVPKSVSAPETLSHDGNKLPVPENKDPSPGEEASTGMFIVLNLCSMFIKVWACFVPKIGAFFVLKCLLIRVDLDYNFINSQNLASLKKQNFVQFF